MTCAPVAASGGVTRLAFGIGALSSGLAAQAITILALIFYNQVVGMSAAAVGLALMISLICDAFWDPAIGLWSDRTAIADRSPASLHVCLDHPGGNRLLGVVEPAVRHVRRRQLRLSARLPHGGAILPSVSARFRAPRSHLKWRPTMMREPA